MVPQSVAYLDPLMRIGTQVSGKGAPKKKVTLQKKIFQRLQLKGKCGEALSLSVIRRHGKTCTGVSGSTGVVRM